MKHKFKTAKRFQYLVIAKCVHCGLQRQKKGDKYLYGDFDNQTEEEPECKPVTIWLQTFEKP
jgi:hypothetical protein